MPLQDDVRGLSPEQRQQAIRVIQSELQSRGKIPPTFGQRVGRGFQAGIRALPSIVGVKTPKEEKITPFERTLQTLSARRLFEKPKEEKEPRVSDIVESAKRKLIQPGATAEDLTKEEKGALGLTKAGQELLTGRAPITPSPEFRTGTGGAISRIRSLVSPAQAELNQKTRDFIESGQIKTQKDLDELVERKEEAEREGIDVDAVLEFFGQR